MRRERIKALVMLVFLAGVSVTLTACVQHAIEFTEFGIIEVQLVVKEPFSPAGVRVSLSGTGITAPDPEHSFTDTAGRAIIRTRFAGNRSFVVATHEDYEITHGGSVAAAQVELGSPCLNVKERGRIILPGPQEANGPDFMYPGIGIAFVGRQCVDEVTPQRLALRPKEGGVARFQAFLEDIRIARNLFSCDQPVPGADIRVTGSFNDFNFKVAESFDPTAPPPPSDPIALADDGCLDGPSGDDRSQDGVFTRRVKLPPGEVSYVFFANPIPLPFRDPYEERSKRVRVVLDRDSTTGVQEVREIIASVMTVKATSAPHAERPVLDPAPPDPNTPPDNFQKAPGFSEATLP